MVIKKRAFSLVEVLAVVIILAILLGVAIPLYLSAIKDSRANAANSGAKSIATAVQTVYVNTNSSTYEGLTATGASLNLVIKALGSGIPANPCVANPITTDLTDYTVTEAKTQFTVTPKSGSNCDADTMVTSTVGDQG